MATLSPVLHAQLGQGVGRLADRGQQVAIGDGAGVARLALPVEGHPVAQAGLDVAVDAVDRHVERAADEPLGEGRVAPVQHLRPRRGPREALGLGGPEGQGVRLRPRHRSRAAHWPAWPALRAGGTVRVSCRRADSPSSRTSLMARSSLVGGRAMGRHDDQGTFSSTSLGARSIEGRSPPPPSEPVSAWG